MAKAYGEDDAPLVVEAATEPMPDSGDDGIGGRVRPGSFDPHPPLVAGARVGERYAIVRFLGQGGMGAVYLARDEALDGQKVALKFVRGSSAGALADLRREVLLAQRVTHPNVCRIYDLEAIDGSWVLKMEAIEGVTLAERLRHGRGLPLDEALALAHGVARGLFAAHAMGIVHRDLKPQNVMIEEGGRVVLMDFGIALAGVSGGAEVVGTPAFMAPEQIRGEPVDARADQYAFGCLLTLMLSGEPPFNGTRAALFESHLHQPPPDPRRLRPDLPAWVASLMRRLLEKDPARRFSDFAAVIDAMTPPRRLTSRHLGGLAALLLGFALSGLVAARLWHSPSPWRPVIRDQSPVFEDDADAIDQSLDGKHFAFSALREGTYRIVVGEVAGGPLRAVTPESERALFAAFARDGRGLYYHRGRDLLGSVSDIVLLSLTDGHATVVDSDATGAADCGPRGLVIGKRRSPGCPDCQRLVLRDGAGERELMRGAPGQLVIRPSCNPDGRNVVFEVDDPAAGTRPPAAVWHVGLDGSAPRRLASGGRNELPRFSADGSTVIIGSDRSGALNVWELTLDGRGAQQLTFGDHDSAPSPTPDGKQLLFLNDTTHRELFVYDVETGNRQQLTAVAHDILEPAVASDGKLFATMLENGRLFIVRVAPDGRVDRKLGEGQMACVAPDGRRLGFAIGRQVGIGDSDGGARRILGELPASVVALAYGGDGALHATIGDGKETQAWRIPIDGTAPAREAPAPVALAVPAPVGGWRAVESVRDGATVVDLLPPHSPWPPPPGQLPTPRALPLRALQWTPDGQAVVARRGQQVVLHTLDGRDRLLATVPGAAAALSPDGKRVYGASMVGDVRRQVLVNFGTRPRLR